MIVPKAGDVSAALQVAGEGRDALTEALPLVYGELRRMAAAELRRGGPATTLQPTVLVHEAYLKLLGGSDPGWKGRAHFFGAAARAMRQIVVDHYRVRKARKRGGNDVRVPLDSELAPPLDGPAADEILAIDEAFSRLEAEYPEHAEVVLLAYFGGLSHEEIAEVRGKSTRTIERQWRFARAWLHDVMAASTPLARKKPDEPQRPLFDPGSDREPA